MPAQTSGKVALLLSGGLDSTVLLYKLIAENLEVYPIFINYNQHFFQTELDTIKKVVPLDIIHRLKIIDVSSIYTESKSPLILERDVWKDHIVDNDLYIPYRSLVMISAGMAFAQSIGCSALYAAFIDTNYVKEVDCSSEFFNRLDSVNDMHEGVKLNLPFRNFRKRDVLEYGISINAPVVKTFSCQITKDIPCGVCPNCVDRNNAFREFEDSQKK